MRCLFKKKDGGPFSKATGYWFFEAKSFGSVVLLRFDRGSRDAFHSHAFDAVSWVLRGGLREVLRDGSEVLLTPGVAPVWTARNRYHKVFGLEDSTWVLSFRGPWRKYWREDLPGRGEVVLTHGRKEVP